MRGGRGQRESCAPGDMVQALIQHERRSTPHPSTVLHRRKVSGPAVMAVSVPVCCGYRREYILLCYRGDVAHRVWTAG